MAEKKSLNQAAQELGLHPNTIKNYQKAGKLPSAEKIKKPGGGFSWIVDVAEVEQAARSSARVYDQPTTYYTPDNNQQEQSTDTDSGGIGNDTGAATYGMMLRQERSELLEKIWSLEAALQDASFERGRLESLERQIERMETERGGLLRLVAVLVVAIVLVALVALILLFLK